MTGIVLDPAGKLPLYNVLVYVPNTALDPIVDGPTCPICDTRTWGNPVAGALTDVDGRFTLQDVPVGDDVPIVIETGKWQRQLTLPHVTACADTQASDGAFFRLPRNRGEGHLPRIAVTTGAGDALECLLRKIGIDDAEFTPESGPGRVNLFAGQGGTDRYDVGTGGGASLTAAPIWWDSLSNLQQYDIVMHSCEDVEISTNKSPTARQAFKDYADAGGRAFLSHWHSTWLENGPAPLPSVATFGHQASLPSPFVASVDVSFPKGFELADWLLSNGASSENGSLQIDQAQHTVSAVTAGLAQRWIYGDPFPDGASEIGSSVQFLTVDTPVEAPVAQRCGRIVLGDLHVSWPDVSGVDKPFPTGCTTTDLSPQEKALEFLFFDQGTCVQAD